jgi:hypothetical protein
MWRRAGAVGDEEDALGAGLGLGRVGAAAGLHLEGKLREGLGEARKGAGKDPGAGPLPAGEVGRDDVALHRRRMKV